MGTRSSAIVIIFVFFLSFTPASSLALSATTVDQTDRQPTLSSSADLGAIPRGVAVDSRSGTIYAVMYLNGTTFAIDPRSLAIAARVATPSPYAVAVDSATDRVYVSQGAGSSSIAVIDGSSDAVVSEVKGAGTPYALAVDGARDLIFAADTGGNSLWIVNGSDNAVIGRVPMGGTSALAYDSSADEVFIGNLSSDLRSGTVDVVNEADPASIRTVQIPIPPMHFSVDPTLHLLFVTSGGAGGGGSSVNFLAIDDRTLNIVYSLSLGSGYPDITAVSPAHDVYVSDAGDARIYELAGQTGQVLSNFSALPSGGIASGEVTGMAVNPSTGALYLTEMDDQALLVLNPAPTVPSLGLSLLHTLIVILILIFLLLSGIVFALTRVDERSPAVGRFSASPPT